MKSILKIALVSGFLGLMPGCGGDGGDFSDFDVPPPRSFISWNGSSNGNVVLAANDVRVQFIVGSGIMFHNNIEWSNVVVNNANVTLNGQPYGAIVLVSGTNNTRVAALVCNNGFLASVGATTMGCSSTRPVF